MTRFTFAVVGHNEAERLGFALGQAMDASRPGDQVWFVDSASTDGSAELAERLGADALRAPLGKGRAMAHALERCDHGYICFLDADLTWSERNLARALRDGVERHRPQMLVGSIRQRTRTRLSVTPAIHNRLVGELFPAVLAQFPPGIFALTGCRALDATLELGGLPPGYGAETHLNLLFSLERRRVVIDDLGPCENPIRGYSNVPQIGIDVANAILDMAEAAGLLDEDARPAWDAWVAGVLDVIRGQPPGDADDSAYLQRLSALAARPLPPRRAEAAA
jgi:glycosyltransferase involved in cell wall biosynthesis